MRVQQDAAAASAEPDPYTVYHDIRPALLPVKVSPVSEADNLTSQVLKEQVQSILQVRVMYCFVSIDRTQTCDTEPGQRHCVGYMLHHSSTPPNFCQNFHLTSSVMQVQPVLVRWKL